MDIVTNQYNYTRLVYLRRALILLLFLTMGIGILFYKINDIFLIAIFCIGLISFSAAFLHCFSRYGVKHTITFLLITWVVSNFFEAISIKLGPPFGSYSYDNMMGLKIFDVPISIMISYFSMGYASWTIAHILTGQFQKRLEGLQRFFIPIISSFILVMWDLVMDPLASGPFKMWTWEKGSSYFNVPISNFFGWFIVSYIFLQSFALYISKYDDNSIDVCKSYIDKTTWFEMIILYSTYAFTIITCVFFNGEHTEIYIPIALICFFTMIFVAILSTINCLQNFK